MMINKGVGSYCCWEVCDLLLEGELLVADGIGELQLHHHALLADHGVHDCHCLGIRERIPDGPLRGRRVGAWWS